MADEIFGSYGVEVGLPTKEDFLKIKETLERIGIPAPNGSKELTQTCHILHKRGRYAIMHFKELFAFDGKPSQTTEEDIGRRNTIVNLLAEWSLVKIIKADSTLSPTAQMNQLKVISFKEKLDWKLVAIYKVGRKI